MIKSSQGQCGLKIRQRQLFPPNSLLVLLHNFTWVSKALPLTSHKVAMDVRKALVNVRLGVSLSSRWSRPWRWLYLSATCLQFLTGFGHWEVLAGVESEGERRSGPQLKSCLTAPKSTSDSMTILVHPPPCACSLRVWDCRVTVWPAQDSNLASLSILPQSTDLPGNASSWLSLCFCQDPNSYISFHRTVDGILHAPRLLKEGFWAGWSVRCSVNILRDPNQQG